jgi:hypothetical protein
MSNTVLLDDFLRACSATAFDQDEIARPGKIT